MNVRGVLRRSASALALASLLGCATAGGRWLDCRFHPPVSRHDEIGNCAKRGADGSIELSARALSVLRERGNDPAAIWIGTTLHYANTRGRAVAVLLYDNGADPFVEGLARIVRDQKIGYVDRELAVRIAPRWDFGFPFDDGTARVCMGCRVQPAGEHQEVVGGRWGRIGPRGEVVVPVRHERDALPGGAP